MIIRTEKDFDIRDGADTVFPMRIVMSYDSGDITVFVTEKYKRIAEALNGMTCDEIFSDAVSARLLTELSSDSTLSGLEGEAVTCTEYAADSRDCINKSLVLDSTELLMYDCNLDNLTEITPDPNNEGLLCFGTVCDGRIVSAAAETPHHPDSTVIEISVDTADGYRNNGFGASNVAALAYYLLDTGILVTYTAEDTNIPSVKLARKAGFSPCQRITAFAFYK